MNFFECIHAKRFVNSSEVGTPNEDNYIVLSD